jgi:hypothetical protein
MGVAHTETLEVAVVGRSEPQIAKPDCRKFTRIVENEFGLCPGTAIWRQAHLRNRSASSRRLPFRLDGHTGMQPVMVRGDYGTRTSQEDHQRC